MGRQTPSSISRHPPSSSIRILRDTVNKRAVRILVECILVNYCRERRQKEKTPIMTMVMKHAPPGQRTRSREEEVIVAVATSNDRILHYQKVASSKKFDFPLVGVKLPF